jgi:hypothetical protein
MAQSAIEKELMRYVARMDDSQKKSLLDMIKVFIKPESQDAGVVSVAEYNKELEEAEAEYERGEFITHEQLLQQVKQW